MGTGSLQVIPCEGGKPHFVHITDVKYVLPVDSVISRIPTFNQFGRKTKLNLNPNVVPDLKWKVSDTLNTKTSIIPIKIEKGNGQSLPLAHMTQPPKETLSQYRYLS